MLQKVLNQQKVEEGGDPNHVGFEGVAQHIDT